jgi:hypothetical protein
MTLRGSRRSEVSALELVEEALGLLRRQPVGVIAVYYLGAVPFVLAGLFFWADMSRSPRALERVTFEAMVLAVLFLWMKSSQLVFMRGLRVGLTGAEGGGWSRVEWLGAVSVQVAMQPFRLVLVPVAALLLVPLPWVLGFFENLTVLGSVRTERVTGLVRRSWRQACLWPMQNQVLGLLLALAVGVVFLNGGLLMVQVPQLMKSLLGIETVFSRSYWAYLNTTFVAACGGLTYLVVDPLVKAVYAVRCFHGESLQSGEDVRAGFRRLAGSVRRVVIGGVVWVGFSWVVGLGLIGGVAWAGEAGPGVEAVAARELDPQELDHAIEEVLGRPLYEWRFPREQSEAEAKGKTVLGGWIEGWLEGVRLMAEGVGRRLERVMTWVGDFMEAVGRRLFGRGWRPSVPGGAIDVAGALQILLWLGMVAAIGGVLALAWRGWRRRGPPLTGSVPSAARGAWLTEEVSAAELPQDEWLRMASEFLGRGERRLALRALYLAALAGLAQAGWITLARFKSNREYGLELRRRARERPEVVAAFGRLLGSFEPVWYGAHEVTGELLDEVRSSLGVIRGCDDQAQAV